eukprot:5551992-Ditylum_brightwellii.AAC.1
MKSDEESTDSDSSAFVDNSWKVKTNKIVQTNMPVVKETTDTIPHSTNLDSGTKWSIIGSPA